MIMSVTHIMTHTGIGASGQGSTEWMYDLRAFPEMGLKVAKKPCSATVFGSERSS